MKKDRFWKIGVPLGVLTAVAVLWQTCVDERAQAPARAIERENEGAQSKSEFERRRAAPESDERELEPAIGLPLPSLELPDVAWVDRYPEATAMQERLRDLPDGRVVREQLLNTGVKRLPLVLWEDVMERDENGEWIVVKSSAFMGNVFLAEVVEEKVDPEALQRFIDERELRVEHLSLFGNYAFFETKTPGLGKLDTLVADFQALFPEAIVEKEVISFPTAFPNDWSVTKVWGLDAIKAPDAWDFHTGSKDVVVAVIDTGLNRGHPDIAANIFLNTSEITGNGRDDDPYVPGPGFGNVSFDGGFHNLIDDVSGWDFVDNDSNPQDDDGHGTHVSGIAGATGDNNEGSVGVGWKVKILPLKVGDQDGLRTAAIVDSLQYVFQLKTRGTNPANIVATNNSYGSGSASAATRDEIDRHQSANILFVAAAGNDGLNLDAGDSLEYPAGYTSANIIAVANSNQEDGLTGSSNYGATSVDISAPGAEIYSTYLNNGYAYLSGTSMASPMVAGAVAVLASAEPELNWQALKKRILDTADRIPSQAGRTVTGGRLNLLSALQPALKGHFVEVQNIGTDMVIIEKPGIDVPFEIGALAGATVTGSVLDGANVGTLSGSGGAFVFSSEAEGVARLRFTATLEGVQRSVERKIVVGDLGDVVAGLKHRFDFDGAGSTETDVAGGANGTYANIQRVDTEFGKSVNFLGGESKMQFNAGYSSKVTIAALIKSENMPVSPHPRILNTPSYYMYLSSGEGPGVPDGNRQTFKFYVNRASGGTPTEGIWNAPPRSIRDGEWFYLVTTYDSSSANNVPTLYINGERQVIRAQSDPAGTALAPAGLAYVGNNGDNSRSFQGLMKSLRVYNRELTEAEVAVLGADLLSRKWDLFALEGPNLAQFASPVEYSLQNYSGVDSSYEVEWTVVSDLGYSVDSQSGADIVLRFNEMGSYRLIAKASDSLVTRYFSKEILATSGEVEPGLHTGETDGGGLVLLWINDDLATGTLSIFDPETGFYRFDAPVQISDTGRFETSEDSIGKVVGTALTQLEGEVSGYDVSFSGALETPVAGESEFVGEYSGGALALAGDSIRLTVMDDGFAIARREGLFADLAFGRIDAAGALVVNAASDDALAANVVLESDSVSGEWGDRSVFLKRAGLESLGKLMAGAIGAAPGGSGPAGLYANFIGAGEQSPEFLESGFYADGSGAVAGDAMMALAADFSTFRLLSKTAAKVGDELALASAEGRLDLSEREIRGIRGQLPLSPGRVGLVGFSVVGDEAKEVLIRCLGPSFAASGAEDPSIRLFALEDDGSASELTGNDDWWDGTLFTESGEDSQGPSVALRVAFEGLGLSALEPESKDAALRIWLPAGRYAAIFEAKSGAAGSALVELFEL